jgi:acrylyl-CoA reductase (NADPH)
MRPTADRVEAWDRLADILEPEVFDDIAKEISLSEAVDVADDLISGKVRGRVVVNINK